MPRPDAALARFKAALDARYGETGARFVVWLADDHDGDPAVYIRVVLPDDDARFDDVGGQFDIMRRIDDAARKAGIDRYVYTSFRGVSEEAALSARA